jgi:2-hydroxychromene-2-carboxylate isomerase
MRVVHYFSPMSGYAYLGFGALGALADRRRASVDHKPIDVMKLFAAVDAVPPAKQSPARLSHRRIDMARWANRRGLVVQLQPRFWPVDATLASCAIIAAQQTGFGATALAGSILSAVWARDLDISRTDVIAALARENGLDASEILDVAKSPATLARYEANTLEAIGAGVIGSPTYRLDDELYFGQDRLDFVDEALAKAMAA